MKSSLLIVGKTIDTRMSEAAHIAQATFEKSISITTTVIDMPPKKSLLFFLPLEEVQRQSFDLIIFIDTTLKDELPHFLGFPPIITWDVPKFGNLAAWYSTHFQQLLSDSYLEAFIEQKGNLDRILGALDEAVLAHDKNRRIFFFSDRAEEITGYNRKEVIGKNCHEIFQSLICGENCQFCDVNTLAEHATAKKYDSILYTKEGSRLEVFTTVSPLTHADGSSYGTVILIKNQAHEKALERRLGEEEQFHRMIGSDAIMQTLYETLRNVGTYDFPVLIEGESGTGKELIADAIHIESRRKGLFVPVNCGAIPEGTLESELFGHVKGSFTGALRDKKGRFELGDGGTIFLDEIGELPLSMQVKLLRVLQESVVEPVGGEKPIKIDVRIISATNKNLKKMVEEGTFREDLYYRLVVVPITVPPLRERGNDVILIARRLLTQLGEKFHREELRFSPLTESTLVSYDFPGNVRQLMNAVQYALIKCQGKLIEPEHLPPEIAETVPTEIIRIEEDPQEEISDEKKYPHLRDLLPEDDEPRIGRKPLLNREAIIEALITTGGNKAKAARLMGVGRATLYNYLQKYPEIMDEVPAV